MNIKLVLVLGTVAAALVTAAPGLGAAKGVVRCVGGAGCYSTIQAAVDAASDGDTINVNPGTFAGGVTIAKSITLHGSGAGRTTISGGGPVLTIGTFGAATEPTVAIDGVTITGGVATSSVESIPFTGVPNVFAAGGGIEVPPDANFDGGATVTLRNAVVSGNRATPTATETAPQNPACPGGPCTFAGAFGGGIDTWGAMTLDNVVVSDNLAGGVASDADGGGIAGHLGAITITNSRILRNRATAVVPNGRFAEGGGLFIEGGSLSIKSSIVDGNAASLSTNNPVRVNGDVMDMNANSGGIHIGDDVPTTVDGVALTNNSISVDDPNGEAVGFDSAMLVNASNLTMRNTLISGNSLRANVFTSEDVGGSCTALELDGGGTISNTRIVGNSSTVTSASGAAGTCGALAVFTFNDDPQLVTVDHSQISGNTATAISQTGTAFVHGAGVYNNSLLTMQYVDVSHNVATAKAPSGSIQGAGIWNGVDLSGPPVQLTLQRSTVIGNVLTRAAGISTAGGGLFTTEPVTLLGSLIALNWPDQCSGC